MIRYRSRSAAEKSAPPMLSSDTVLIPFARSSLVVLRIVAPGISANPAWNRSASRRACDCTWSMPSRSTYDIPSTIAVSYEKVRPPYSKRVAPSIHSRSSVPIVTLPPLVARLPVQVTSI